MQGQGLKRRQDGNRLGSDVPERAGHGRKTDGEGAENDEEKEHQKVRKQVAGGGALANGGTA